jgi:ADP-glucose pyrophosphorylase
VRIRRAIIDKGVKIPSGMEIGFDPEKDRARGFTVSPSGLTVISQTDAVRLQEGEPDFGNDPSEVATFL